MFELIGAINKGHNYLLRCVCFLQRQFKQVGEGGWPVILRKIRILTLQLYDLLLMPLALLVVLIVRALRPLLTIRFGTLCSLRLGHFAANTEIYLCKYDAGMHDKRTYDIFYNWKPVCNSQLKKMWDRILHVTPLSRLTRLIIHLNGYLPGYEKHIVDLSTDRDIYGFYISTPPHLSFTLEEQGRGQCELEKIGIPENTKFICLHARDSAYLNALIPEANWAYHNFRDSDINNFLHAAEELVKRGYYVLRMGVKVQKYLESDKPGIIDYATRYRTHFLDIYLGANCYFYLGDSCGITAVMYIFRRPVATTNMIPLEYVPTWGNSLFIPKKLWLRKERRFMTFPEIMDSGVGRFLQSESYERAGIDIVDNTFEEITALAIEMDERLRGTWQTTEDDEELQHRFWLLFKQSKLHGKISARIGTEFLRQNRQLLK